MVLAPLAGLAAGPRSHRVSPDMRKAIAFEKRKAAADARQARLEQRRPASRYSEVERSVESQPRGRRVPDPGEPQYRQRR